MCRELVTKDGRELRLRPAGEEDAADLIRMIDSVARERTYFLRSRWDVDLERERALILDAAERGDLMLVASVNGRPVGWVTVLRARPEFLRHTGELGMGVIRGYRGQGVGSALMEYALHWAANQGLEKVNLGVRASNARAKALYAKFGFREEGRRVREIKDQQGRYDDSLEMSYFVPVAGPPGVDGLRPTENVEGGPGA